MSASREMERAGIGRRLKLERLRLGLSQPTLAALAGVALDTAIKWETGAPTPTATALAAFAGAGADILFIVTGRRTPLDHCTGDAGHSTLQALQIEALSKRLYHLDPIDRRSILLALFADEFRR